MHEYFRESSIQYCSPTLTLAPSNEFSQIQNLNHLAEIPLCALPKIKLNWKFIISLLDQPGSNIPMHHNDETPEDVVVD